jgi:hypothetical protein
VRGLARGIEEHVLRSNRVKLVTDGVDDNRKVWMKTLTLKKIVEKLPPCPPK